MGSDCLGMEFDFNTREMLIGYGVDLFIAPIDFTFEDSDPSQNKMLVFFPIWIAGFVNVEQMHK